MGGFRLLSRESRSSDEDWVSLSTSKDYQKDNQKASFDMGEKAVMATVDCGGVQEDRSGDSWLPQKVVQCGKAVGLSVDCCHGGWSGVLRFVEDRENPDKERSVGSKFKKKGMRELQNLSTSIN